jgi:hypothetical protein
MPSILEKHLPEQKYKVKSEIDGLEERSWVYDPEKSFVRLRAWNGGMPSCRPDRWDSAAMPSPSCRARVAKWSWFHGIMAFFVVLSGTLFAWFLSESVPPNIFSCRQIAQSSALWFWLPSFGIQYLVVKLVAIRKKWQKWAMRFLLFKDTVSSLAILDAIMVTQWGVLNRSSKSTRSKHTCSQLIHF